MLKRRILITLLVLLALTAGYSCLIQIGARPLAWILGRGDSRRISSTCSLHFNSGGAAYSGLWGVWVVRNIGPFQWVSGFGYADCEDLFELTVAGGAVRLYDRKRGGTEVNFSVD